MAAHFSHHLQYTVCHEYGCIVLYREFLEWPKYKLQGPLEKQDELTNS